MIKNRNSSQTWLKLGLKILEFHQNLLKNIRNSRISSKSAKKILEILEFLNKYFAPKSQNIKTQSRFLHALNQFLPS